MPSKHRDNVLFDLQLLQLNSKEHHRRKRKISKLKTRRKRSFGESLDRSPSRSSGTSSDCDLYYGDNGFKFVSSNQNKYHVHNSHSHSHSHAQSHHSDYPDHLPVT